MIGNWRDDVHLPPSVNVPSYCGRCRTYTHWKRSKAFLTRLTGCFGGKVEYSDVLKCVECGNSVKV